MRHRSIARLVLVAPLLFALPAGAQTRTIFAGAGVIADNDKTNSAMTERPARSWTVVVGMDVIAHVGVRLMIDTPREVSGFSEGIYTRAAGCRCPEVRVIYFGIPDSPSPYIIRSGVGIRRRF